MKRPVTFQKKASSGAPLYMLQYSDMMTILLSFFILILVLGKERTAQFKDGLGNVKNLVDMTGGKGVMDFWRSMRKPGHPINIKESEPSPASAVGYEEGASEQSNLDEFSIHKVDFVDNRKTLRLRSSIRFLPGQVRMDRNTQFALDHAVATIYSLRNYNVVVCVLVDTGKPEADRLLAAQRAAWLVRSITENAQIPRKRIRALGQVGSLVNEESGEPVEVVLLLRDKRANSYSP